MLDQVYKGVDLHRGARGRLGCAVVLLVGTLVFRGLARAGRTVVAVLMIVAGVVAVRIGRRDDPDGEHSPRGAVHRRVRHLGGGHAADRRHTRQQLEDRIDTTLGAGIWLTLAGGFLGFVGGTLSLAYAVRLDDDDEGAVAAI